MRQLLFLAVLAAFTGGCTTVPEAISEAPPGAPSLLQARADVEAHVGKRLRWGGVIAEVENRATETWVYVVARPLNGSGRPRETGESEGRFIAKVKGFLDPAIYSEGRLITVAGTLAGKHTRSIGEFPYVYVTVDADTTKLWERIVARPYYYPDPFYDPFYDPFWPSRVYPWYPWYPPHPYYPYWR